MQAHHEHEKEEQSTASNETQWMVKMSSDVINQIYQNATEEEETEAKRMRHDSETESAEMTDPAEMTEFDLESESELRRPGVAGGGTDTDSDTGNEQIFQGENLNLKIQESDETGGQGENDDSDDETKNLKTPDYGSCHECKDKTLIGLR